MPNWPECRQLWQQQEKCTQDAPSQETAERLGSPLNPGRCESATANWNIRLPEAAALKPSRLGPYGPPHRFWQSVPRLILVFVDSVSTFMDQSISAGLLEVSRYHFRDQLAKCYLRFPAQFYPR